ncbi:MAG: BrnT family toxin [Balneolaceae bacterium]|nr:BrnT family toxin [Balneolaceae bacterium]
MQFEFDTSKSESNKLKHGIDFQTAQLIWLDQYLIEIPAKSFDEKRRLVIGKIDNKIWSAIITYRGDSRRIISVRRARKKEIDLYENL